MAGEGKSTRTVFLVSTPVQFGPRFLGILASGITKRSVVTQHLDASAYPALPNAQQSANLEHSRG